MRAAVAAAVVASVTPGTHVRPSTTPMVSRPGGYLTAPGHRVAQRWLAGHGVKGLRLVRDYTSADGIRHLQWAQRVCGIRVVDADVRANVFHRRLLSIRGAPVRMRCQAPHSDVVAYHAGSRLRLARRVRRRGLIAYADGLVHDNALGVDPGGTPSAHDLTPWLDAGAATLKGPNVHAYVDADDETTTAVTPYVIADQFAVPPAGEVGPSSGSDWLYPVTPYGTGTWDPQTPASWQTNASQAATQLFYLVNRFHDHLLAPPIDFDAASGNFEGADAVLAQADDGANRAKRDVAAFLTRPDGTPGSLELSLWSNGRNPADDPSVVFHELTHGLAARLITDAQGFSAVSGPQSGALTEGWGDFYALDYLAQRGLVTDGPGADVVFGAYLGGLRSAPIDTPVAGGGHTFGDFGRIAATDRPEPHADGEIWGQTLWQLRQALIAAHGTAEGTRRAELYVTGGMRLGPAQPSFLDQRDAILAADTAAGGEDRDLIWQVFAGRGMGYFAATTGDTDFTPEEDFSLPPAGGPRGSVSGTVTDDAGATVSGVTVSLGAPELHAVTNALGGYRIAGVPYATYPRLVADAPAGYADATLTGITVGGDVSHDLVLRRNYAATATVSGRDDSAVGCGPGKLVDGDTDTAVQTARPATFTVTLSAPVIDPEVLIDPTAGCGNRADSSLHRYELQASTDGVSFSPVADGSFTAASLGRLNRVVLRDAPPAITALRLVATDALGPDDGGYLSLSELEVLARAPTPMATPTATYVVPTPTPVPRRRPFLSATVTPKRDVRPPYRYTVRGKLGLPRSVSRRDGCDGRVRITVQLPTGRVVGSRVPKVKTTCRFERKLQFRRARLRTRHGRLRFVLRFQGNLVLKPRSTSRRVKFGPVRLPQKPTPTPTPLPQTETAR
jgi:extracellular elastinolytic metalloproteinase